MNLFFTLREGIKGLARARLATTISVTSIAFALFLIGMFVLFALNVNRWIGDTRSKIELEVFLDADIDGKQGLRIADEIKKLSGVASVSFISKSEAAERFKKEFGRDVNDVLESNPLPSSCSVKIAPSHQTATDIASIVKKINKLDGVSETVYEREVLLLIDRYLNILYLVSGVIGVILLLIATVLLYNTIRLTIYARRDIIEIMKLVGATDGFIRRPFIVEGFFQGLIGAALASAMLFGGIQLLMKFVYPYVIHDWRIYVTITVFGIGIGILSSKLSVSNHLARLI